MIADQWCRVRMVAAWLSLTLLLGGCASMGSVPEAQYAARRLDDYPIAIIPAAFAPPIEIPLQLRGKGEGAVVGAGQGALACLEGALHGTAGSDGAIAGLAVLFCVTVGSVVGGVVGAVTAEPGTTSAVAQVRLDRQMDRLDPQRALAETVRDYLHEFDGTEAAIVPDAVLGPASVADLPGYAGAGLADAGSLLELRVSELGFSGSGRKDAPICLRMAVRARKLDAGSLALVDDMQLERTVACFPTAQWLEPDHDLLAALADGYRRIAEDVVEEFYLVYQLPQGDGAKPGPAAAVPPYVLAPLVPPPPEVYLDIDLFQSRRDRQAFGGLHFRDVDTLSPEFRWEAFPRAAELDAEGASAFSDVSYEWRLYTGILGLAVQPGQLLEEVRGLAEPHYAVGSALQPCGWYFWTVRARFRLHGVWRTTEWAGAYNTAGGHYSPSSGRRNYGNTLGFIWPARVLYYPFRTPAAASDPGCWDE